MPLGGKSIANLFYEPSTRTSFSFYSAMTKLGGTVIPINEVNYSSVSKGETLEDTIRTLECYADAIVLRHYDDDATERAFSVSSMPIINAGNGSGEHPTQALLDLYTIQRERGSIDGLTITMMGDLKYGRTVHSSSNLLRMYDVKLSCSSSLQKNSACRAIIARMVTRNLLNLMTSSPIPIFSMSPGFKKNGSPARSGLISTIL